MGRGKLNPHGPPAAPNPQPQPHPHPQPPMGRPDALAGAGWRLRLLGAVELRDSRDTPVRLPSRAATLLLAQLALGADREHAREELIDLLWPQAPLGVGRNRLRQTLSTLRSVLEPAGSTGAPVLLADRRAVRLVPGSLVSDTEVFGAALRRADTHAAARSYAGELLPGYYDDWIIDERRRLAALAEGLQAPSNAAAGRGLQTPQAPVEVPPLAAPAHRLPLYLTRLMGFDAAGAALTAAVEQQRLVVLRGPGGAGKTRLAVEVARCLAQGAGWAGDAAPRFDIVVFVPLASCEQRAAFHDAVLLALRHESSAAEPAAADAAARLEAALAGRRALLVLDNFEQLVEEARQDLARWLSCLPGLHLLVTSRRSLGLDGEVEQALAALPLPAPGAPLHELALNPAVALFVDRARAVRADFHLGDRNQALVADIVRQLHGLPLAVELAAARVRSVSLVDMRDMLRAATAGEPSHGMALLTRSGPRSAEDARHASMLAVVDWSWQRLDAAQQRQLTQLSAFDGGATLHAVSAMHGGEPAEVASGLDSLVAASVVFSREGSDGRSRYHAFEPVREYVLNALDGAARADLRQQQLQAMLAWARGLGHAPALDAFRDELPNLLSALATAQASGQPLLALQLALDCASALEDVSLPPSGLQTLRSAVAAVQAEVEADSSGAQPAAARLLVARCHGVLAERLFDAGQSQAALWHAEQGLALAPAGSAARAGVLYAAARVQVRVTNDTTAAAALAAEALQLALQHNLRHVQAQVLVLQGVLAVRVDHDMPRDAQLKQQALALWQAMGNPARVASAQVNLSLSMGFARRFAEQLQYLELGSQSAAANGQRRLWAFAQSVQGYVQADLRRWDASAGSYLGCLRAAWDISAWREWFYALWNLPRTLAHSRRPEAAARLMGFADAFYTQRFGALGWEDLRERRRTRRLVRAQSGAAREGEWWLEGARMSLTQAMELACAEAGHVAAMRVVDHDQITSK